MCKPVQLVFLVFLFFILFPSCGSKNKSAGDSPGRAQQGQNGTKSYAVITLTPRRAVLNSDYPATIQGQQNIEIRPKIDGYVNAIYVDEGSSVKRGQLLFRISAPQYEQNVRTALANIKIAQADVDAARMQVNKVRPLVERNIISHYELESAQYNVEAKQAALAQAQANLANARINLGYTIINSPVTGVVGNLPYRIGSLVSSTTPNPLTTISSIGNIYAYFSINEKQALNFSETTKGATTQARLATLPPVTLLLANGAEFPQKGRIETASGIINTQTGSVNVRATFPNPSGLVRSGSTATVRIPRTIDTALLIPQKATYEIQGKLFVYVVNNNNKVQSVEIQVNPNTAGQSYVVQQGLHSGDKIVIEGITGLREELPIQPKIVDADSVFNSF